MLVMQEFVLGGAAKLCGPTSLAQIGAVHVAMALANAEMQRSATRRTARSGRRSDCTWSVSEKCAVICRRHKVAARGPVWEGCSSTAGAVEGAIWRCTRCWSRAL